MHNKSNIIFVLIVTLLAGCNPQTGQNAEMPTATTDSDIATPAPSLPEKDTITAMSPGRSAPNFNILRGDWVRTDGGYTISIRNVAADGTLKADYFNPNPINVGRSRWETEEDSLYLQVELQDVNYPGSIYTLQYLPQQDQLSGIYFQAVEGATYEVLFNRKRY